MLDTRRPRARTAAAAAVAAVLAVLLAACTSSGSKNMTTSPPGSVGAPSSVTTTRSSSGASPNGPFAGKPPLTLPAVVQTGKDGVLVFTKLTINGKPYYFNVDSGADITTIDPTIAKSAGLKTVGNGPPLKTIGCTVKTTIVQLENWSLGSLKLPAAKLPAQPNAFAKLKIGGLPVAGQLGADLQALSGRVQVDYAGKKVTFAAAKPTSGTTVPVKVEKASGGAGVAVLAPVSVGSTKLTMQVDTGASHSTVSSTVATELKLKKAGPPQTATAISCKTTVQPVSLPSLTIGATKTRPTVAAEAKTGSPADARIAGLFGSDLLSGFKVVTFDYTGQTLTLGG